jgi:membrane protein DedA with SNARE-associated domain
VQSFLAHFGYVAVFAALVAGGLGVPVPEELTQLTAGALAHEGILDLRIAIPVVWAGILAGDAVLFFLARHHGPRVLETRAARRVLTPSRREWLERHFARHAFWTIAVARHAGGLRFPTFALAGTSGVRPATFLLADGLSALVSVPFVVGAGWLFWQHLSEARHEVRRVELAVLAVLAVIALVVVLVRRRRARAAAAAGPGAEREGDALR